MYKNKMDFFFEFFIVFLFEWFLFCVYIRWINSSERDKMRYGMCVCVFVYNELTKRMQEREKNKWNKRTKQ